MLSCSPARRSWSATCRASGSGRRSPGSGAATGRSAPIRRMPIRPRLCGRAVPAPGWTVRLAIFRPQRRATAQWPFRSGNLPVRRAGRRCGTLAMTPNGPATSASHRLRVAPCQIERATTCDTLIARLGQLAKADPSLLLQSHPVTSDLAGQPSPLSDPAYKHQEDLIDACCAPGLHHCGRATVSTAARSSACPPIPRAARQPP